MVSTNFEDFGDIDYKQIYFNTAQTATIEVIEYNFYESDMNIVVKSKASGTAHSAADEGWYDIGYIRLVTRMAINILYTLNLKRMEYIQYLYHRLTMPKILL